jgi:GcrA cell cycle regulator
MRARTHRLAQPVATQSQVEAITMIGTQATWTPERVALLKEGIDAGLTCGQMARMIGVSRNAVIGKVNRLGLSRFKSATGGLPGRTVGAQSARPKIVTQHRILKALLTEPQLPFAETPLDSANRCSLLELQHGHCRWPISDPGADDFVFCGNKQVDGLPYCAAHARMAYQASARVNVHRKHVA